LSATPETGHAWSCFPDETLSPILAMAPLPPLLILTEGDRRRGLGHLGRCLAYAEHWRRAGRPARWIVEGDDAAQAVLGREAVRWEAWQHRTQGVAAKDEVVIVDSYEAEPADLAPLARCAGLTVCLDDLERDGYPPGLVIHTSPGGLDRSGRVARWLIGPAWQPMAPAFWSVPERSPPREAPGKALVLTGGTDLRGISPLLASLIRRTLPDCEVHQVLGAGAGPAPMQPGVVQHRNVTPEALRDLMLDCDLAVSAAGQTLFQLACCGTPTIMVGVADNQARHLRQWPETGAMTAAGVWDDPNLQEKVVVRLLALQSRDARAAMSRRGRDLVDGQGVARLAGMIGSILA
jgi:spore coat polysaccharide biosynthesis predicted glycosyltransferase SpsG